MPSQEPSVITRELEYNFEYDTKSIVTRTMFHFLRIKYSTFHLVCYPNKMAEGNILFRFDEITDWKNWLQHRRK
jgi:hypothetical protein